MPAADTAFRSEERFTQARFRRWVEKRPRGDVNRYELVDGRIVMTPPAGWTHARVESRIQRFLSEHVEESRLGVVLGSSAGYELPSGDTLEPDASFVSRERLAAGPSPKPDGFPRLVPNLVVEILSPATTRRDRTEKKEIYERNGVDEYWIVDPKARAVTVHCRDADAYGESRTFQHGNLRSRVLPRLRLAVDKLFA